MQLRDFGAQTIVVRLPNWVGDAVMATPALRALRLGLPTAELVAVGTPTVCELLGGLPAVDRFVPYDRRRQFRGAGGFLRFARRLAQESIAAGVLLPHSFSAAALFRLAGVRRLLGYRTVERSWLLSDPVDAPSLDGRRIPRPMTRHYLELLAAAGVESHGEHLELAVADADRAALNAYLEDRGVEEDEPILVANPGASFGPSKQWTLSGFRDTLRALHSRLGWRTVLNCAPDEVALAREVATWTGPAAIDTSDAPIPLSLVKPLLERARLLISTDTGPRHIATALGTPVVVLMGPTDPRYTASNLESTRVLRVDVECGPCHRKLCPLDHRCMNRLTAHDAIEAALELLARPAPDRPEYLHA